MRTSTVKSILKHLIVIVIGFVSLYPVLWMIGSSFKPNSMIFSETWFWPQIWTLDNYINGMRGTQGSPFYIYITNSIIISLGAVIGSVISCSFAGYAIARLNFRFKKIAFGIMMATIMLPVHVKLIPQYIMFNQLGWIDTFLPIVLPKFFAVEGFFTFLIIQFIRGIPKDLDEAATIDGCGNIRIYWSIIMPLSKPALITTAMYAFLWTWDDFLSQLIFLSNNRLYTVPLGLRLFLDSSSQSDWGAMFAMSVISLLPCLIIFALCQKHFVQGVATTGMKG